MNAHALIRWLRATGVACCALTAGVLLTACESLLEDGQAVERKECATCHLPAYEAATQPVHVGVFPRGCGDCHGEEAWSPTHGFDHDKYFPLRGAHTGVDCATCHTSGFAAGATPDTCVGCHRDDYDGARMPAHGGFSTRCNTCHEESGWRPATFDHSWPLTGVHAVAACTGCHVGTPPVYEGTSKQCVSCHRDDYDASPHPGHATFPTTCQNCHTTAAWQPATVDHSWPLTGAHATAMCASCHVGSPPLYAGTSKECVSCHRDDYDKSPYPGHATFPTTCQQCHTTQGWTPATGGTHPESRFPIKRGPHSPFKCLSCHDESLGPIGKDNTDCVGCHTGEHSRSRMDKKHDEVSKYPTGAASPRFCLDCHSNGGR